MAYTTYLVTAPRAQLRKLAKKISASTDLHGDPLAGIGAARALIGPVVAEQLAAAHPQTPLAQLLLSWGAQRVEAVAPEHLKALYAFVEPSEITLERPTTPKGMARNGLDWHIAATRLDRAWAAVNGPKNIDWGEIQVGQIDTGYTEHPCLGWKNGQSDVVNTRDDRNFFTRELEGESDFGLAANRDPYSAEDPLTGPNGGHGTRTGTVLAGFDESAAAKKLPDGSTVKGYYGAAPKVPYVPIRLSNCVMIDDMTSELGDALEHLLEGVRVQVITISMGAAGPLGLPAKTRDMIDRAYRRGVIVCCAAGNHVPFIVTPARAPRTIAVAGAAPGDVPWSGSSFGPQADVAAPAWPVRRASTDPDGNFEYGYGDGTSYATPQVAGTAALWLAKHGAALDAEYPEGWMRVEAFKRLVVTGARTPSGWDTARYGAGILDAGKVLAAALPAAGSLRPDDEPHFRPAEPDPDQPFG